MTLRVVIDMTATSARAAALACTVAREQAVAGANIEVMSPVCRRARKPSSQEATPRIPKNARRRHGATRRRAIV
jgi:hypothetical protein